MSGMAPTALAIAGMFALAGIEIALGHGDQLAGQVVAGLLGWMQAAAKATPSPIQTPEAPK